MEPDPSAAGPLLASYSPPPAPLASHPATHRAARRWHQNVSAEDPMIYHYTFGVEYALDGIPVVGSVGEWSLDKRHYFGALPPKQLAPPPHCALECAWVLLASGQRGHARVQK